MRQYLKERPEAAAAEVSAATGVELERLMRWARAGRLQFRAPGGQGALSCQSCGAPIPSGRLCARCAAELADQARAALQGGPPSNEGQPPDPARGRPSGADEGGPGGRRGPQVHTIKDIRRRFG